VVVIGVFGVGSCGLRGVAWSISNCGTVFWLCVSL
jgi:hypothetical protein